MVQTSRSQFAMNMRTCAVTLLALVPAMVMVGCDRTAELAEKERTPQRVGKLVTASAGSVDRAALDLLEKSAAAYSRITSYEDAGRVVLSYKFDGKQAQDVAPLSFAYESPNRLGMKAYQVLAGSTQNRFRLRVESNAKGSPLSKQVISRELPKQLSLPWLMSDPLAVEHWAAGLAGSPPQMELLLGEEPFRALLEGASQVSLDGQGTEAGQSYKIVKIQRGQAVYRLWISATSSLLRRIELPTATLPPAMLADAHIADIHLSVELDDPRVGGHVDWSKWEVPVGPLDQLVRYFVAPPMTAIDPKLGKAIPAFRLPPCAPGQMGWDTSAMSGMGKVQVLLWLADHPSCRATLEQLNKAMSRIPQPLREQVVPVVVWAEAHPPEGLTFASLKQQWQIDMPIVHDDGEIGRDVLAIAEAPALMVLDAKHRLQFMQQRGNPLLADILPDMLMRLSKGENLAQGAIEQVQSLQDRFIAGLWQARASDCVIGGFTKPSACAPALFRLEEVDQKSVRESIASLQADAMRNLWMLRGDGKLLQLSPSGKVEREFESNLASDDGRGNSINRAVRMAVDEAGKFVALCPHGGDKMVVIETATSKSAFVQLNKQNVTDFRWLGTPTGLRLAAITQSGKTLLIDPSRFEQHSGQSNQMPLAILPRVAEEALTSGYVIMRDGHIEPLIVQDEGGAKAAVLGQPALGQPASISFKDTSERTPANASQVNVVLKSLQFTPACGPWIQWRDAKRTLTLARGWLASDEPAVYVLDDKLQQLWHAPLAIQEGAEICGASVALDPVSNQPLWVLATEASTLHFLRADGQFVDDCRLPEEVRGLALVPVGQELRLWVAYHQRIAQYRFQPR